MSMSQKVREEMLPRLRQRYVNRGRRGRTPAASAWWRCCICGIKSFDCDNGSEFLNWHLVRYLQERPRKVGFTRSRPYHKNDNGHD